MILIRHRYLFLLPWFDILIIFLKFIYNLRILNNMICADYDLEIENVIEKIKESDSKKILIQLPDGLKAFSDKIVDEIEIKTNAKCFIFMGDCFGACDTPVGYEKLGFDLLVSFGHSEWRY